MNGFGLARIKQQGAPCHPDDCRIDCDDDFYLEQLQAYAGWRGVEETKKEWCNRPHLLKELDE